jgi:hypothetical protein
MDRKTMAGHQYRKIISICLGIVKNGGCYVANFSGAAIGNVLASKLDYLQFYFLNIVFNKSAYGSLVLVMSTSVQAHPLFLQKKSASHL